jgi:hypothetical protein
MADDWCPLKDMDNEVQAHFAKQAEAAIAALSAAPQAKPSEVTDCGHENTIARTKRVLVCDDCAELIEVID